MSEDGGAVAEVPVAVAALIWSMLALFVLVTPAEALVPVLIIAGLFVVGGEFFLTMLVFDRKSLEPLRRSSGALAASRRDVWRG